jgi:phosphoserine phosphatase RsbU/P
MVTTYAAEASSFEPIFEDNAAGQMQCMEVWGGSQLTTRAMEFGGLDCWVYSKPHGEAACGGDVYYASSCATGRIIRLLLADVAGHGQAVATIADDLRALMRRFVNRLDQTEFVRLLNDQFATSSRGDVFATAIVATFFAPSRRLRLCNAGHPRPLLYSAFTRQWGFAGDGHAVREELGNLPLGILEQVLYEHIDIELQPGDCLLTFTDALTESYDDDGEMLGEAGVLRILQSMGGDLEPRQLIGLLKDEILRRNPANLCDDDVTVLLVRANGRELRYPLADRLGAFGRFVKALFCAIDPRMERPPLPDWRLANIGGALIPALGRRWRAPHSSS